MAAAPAPWHLQELLKYAVENSPVISKAKQDKQFAQLEENKVKSYFLPRLRLESTHGLRNQTPTPYDNAASSLAALTFKQNIWNEGLDQKRLNLARLGKRQAELTYFQQRDQLCLDLAQEYYSYSLLVKSLEIQKNQQKLLHKQFELISDEYLHGLRSRRDFLRFKSQAQRADLDLQNKITLVEKSRLNLLALAGFNEIAEGQHFLPEDSRPTMLDLFRNPAELNNTYEDQLYRLSEQNAELTRDLSVKQLDPLVNLDLKASLGSHDYWTTNSNWNDNQSKNWSAFITFNWTFWDGGEIRSKEAQANLQNEIVKTDLRQKKINLQSEIRKLQTQFLQLKQNFKTSEELLVLEQNNFLFLEGEYRQNKTTYLDYMNGIRDLAEAQNRHWGNLFDLKKGIALYHYYKGSLFRFLMNDENGDTEEASDESVAD